MLNCERCEAWREYTQKINWINIYAFFCNLLGSFFLPRDQQKIPPDKSSDFEGLAYLGEYPLAWAACINNETVYNLLLDHDADPDKQDSFGNMILHMVVVTDQLVRYANACCRVWVLSLFQSKNHENYVLQIKFDRATL